MELYKENEEIQINDVHIISFPIIAILKIKEFNSLHSKLFTKDLFFKKNPSSFVRVLLKKPNISHDFFSRSDSKRLPRNIWLTNYPISKTAGN